MLSAAPANIDVWANFYNLRSRSRPGSLLIPLNDGCENKHRNRNRHQRWSRGFRSFRCRYSCGKCDQNVDCSEHRVIAQKRIFRCRKVTCNNRYCENSLHSDCAEGGSEPEYHLCNPARSCRYASDADCLEDGPKRRDYNSDEEHRHAHVQWNRLRNAGMFAREIIHDKSTYAVSDASHDAPRIQTKEIVFTWDHRATKALGERF